MISIFILIFTFEICSSMNWTGNMGGDFCAVHCSRRDFKSKVRILSGKLYLVSDPKIPSSVECNNPQFVTVDPTRREYDMVKKEMESNFELVVTKVQRIMNKCLWRRYYNYRDSIEQEDLGAANETYLILFYDGQMTDIAREGLDERYDGRSYGDDPSGLRLLDIAGYRSNMVKLPKGNWHYYIGRVALGSVYRITSRKTMFHPPHGYHSVSVDVSNGVTSAMKYFVFKGEQIYPEYRVFFQII